MKLSRWSFVVLCAALAIAVALGLDWLAAELFGLGSPHSRWWLLATVLVLAGGSLGYLLSRHLADRKRIVNKPQNSTENSVTRAAMTNASHRDATRIIVGDASQGEVSRLQRKVHALSRQIKELQAERSAYEHSAKSLEAQSRRVRSVLSALGEPVLVIDKRDQLVLTNSSANRLLAIEPPGDEKPALTSLDRCEQLVELLAGTRRTRDFTQRQSEIEVVDPEGTPRWFRVTTRNIPTQPGDSDPDGTSQGAVALLHDISAQRRLQKRNSALVTAVSHEMRTPLANIIAYVELLHDGEAETPELENKFFHIVTSNATRLRRLVDNLVDLARIEADLAGEQKQTLPLADILADAIAVTRELAERKGVRLEVNSTPPDALVSADNQLLVRAVAELITNAIHYTQPAGLVTVRGARDGNSLTVEVVDPGIGISQQDQFAIFQKFHRVSASRKMADGTGLGLPLVKHIVEEVHAGRIAVESAPGEGSTFRVTLPVSATSTHNLVNTSPGAAMRSQTRGEESGND